MTVPSYGYLVKKVGTYRRYTVEIHSQVPLTEDHYAPEDIAEISSLVVSTAKSKLPDRDLWRYKALDQMLMHVHVIVVKDSDALQALWLNKRPGKRFLAMTGRSIFTCWDAPNNTVFYTIISKEFKKGHAGTVIHEVMHVVGRVLDDDSDPGHTDPKL